MTFTDGATLFLSSLLLVRGGSRGFIKSLLNPFSIIVTSILSVSYYQMTNDMITSLLIGLIGPIVLSFILKLIIRSWPRAFDIDVKPDFFSSLTGAILTLAWGWVFIIFTLILLTILPPWGTATRYIHDDVTRSISYTAIVKPLRTSVFGALKVPDPNAASPASNNDDKPLTQDPRFQKIMQDPEIQKAINDHDYVKLMGNPKMIAFTNEVMKDPATMKKIMTLYNNQFTGQDQAGGQQETAKP